MWPRPGFLQYSLTKWKQVYKNDFIINIIISLFALWSKRPYFFFSWERDIANIWKADRQHTLFRKTTHFKTLNFFFTFSFWHLFLRHQNGNYLRTDSLHSEQKGVICGCLSYCYRFDSTKWRADKVVSWTCQAITNGSEYVTFPFTKKKTTFDLTSTTHSHRLRRSSSIEMENIHRWPSL